jgi:transposase-like protein
MTKKKKKTIYGIKFSKEPTNCANCGTTYVGYGHNGAPLVDGFVCNECQSEVLKLRLTKTNWREL